LETLDYLANIFFEPKLGINQYNLIKFEERLNVTDEKNKLFFN